MPVFALDIGTSSIRGAFFDDAANRISGKPRQIRYTLQRPEPGAAELLPDDLAAGFRQILPDSLDPRQAHGVGISSMWHGLIAVERHSGRPLSNAFIWEDSRAQSHRATLTQRFSPGDFHQRTGCPLDRTFWPLKLLWLRRHQPRLFTPRTLWMAPAEWLLYQRDPALRTTLSMASATGLLSRHTLQWDPEILEFLQLDPQDNLLPLSEDPGIQLCGRPVLCIIGDGAAGNIGSGAIDSRRLAMNFGTSAALRACGSAPLDPAPGLFQYRLDAQYSVYGGALNNAGNLHAWLLNTLRLSERQARQALTDPHHAGPIADLHAAPFWGGERSPFWDGDLSGSLHGLRFHHKPLDIYLAVMDAAFYRVAALADLLTHSLPERAEPREIIISGGLAQSAHSLRRLANILGQPLGLLDEQEVSLRGAAVMASRLAQGEGWFPPEIRQKVQPEPDLAQEFQKSRARYEEFFNAS